MADVPKMSDEDGRTPESADAGEPGPDGPEVGEEAEDEYREIAEDGWEDVLGSGRLRKRVLVEGVKGPGEGKGRPHRGDTVKVRFKGFFQDRQFVDEPECVFVTSEGEVVAMLDLVVVLMNVGEKCEVVADPEFAYGKVGFGEIVPPRAAVRAEIELVSYEAPVPVADMSLAARQEVGRRKKNCGNFWFSRQNYSQAVQCYRKAGELFDDERIDLEVPADGRALSEELRGLLEDRLNAFNNLAAAEMKLYAWDAALGAIKQVLKIEPNNEKALYRKSRILTEKCRPEEALGVLKRIVQLYPENTSARADLAKLTAKQKKSRLNEERMSKKMLGLDRHEAERKPQGWLGTWPRSKFVLTSVVLGVSVGFVFGRLDTWLGNH